MGHIPDDVVEQVRRAVDIVEVIDGYVSLKRAGSGYKALSPFNKEKTPSFTVSPQRQIFKCYSSGHGGDVFKFLQLYENIDFPTAVRKLAERANIVIPEGPGKGDDKQKKFRDRLLTMHDELTAYWREKLKHEAAAHPAREYMRGREIPLSWADHFGLGFAPESWDDTLQWGNKKGYSQDEMIEAGVVVRNEQGRVYDRFRGRLVFPIRNENGQVVAFSARVLDPESKMAKYINSPETPIYKKGAILFGLHSAKRAILDNNLVILVEGQLDVLRCHAAGVAHVVAPLGTAFSADHARILQRFKKNIVICLDADKAGRNAATRVADVWLSHVDQAELLLNANLGIRVAMMPEGQDPDSLIRRQGHEAFLKLVAEADDYVGFLIHNLSKEHSQNGAAGRREVVDKVSEFLGKISNATLREQLTQQAALQLRLSVDALGAEIAFHDKRSRRSERKGAGDHQVQSVAEFRCHPLLHDLVRVLLGCPQSLPLIQQKLVNKWVADLPGAELFSKLLELVADEEISPGDVAAAMSHCTPSEQNFLSSINLDGLDQFQPEDLQKVVDSLMVRLELDWINATTRILAARVNDKNIAAKEKSAEMKELHVLMGRKNILTAASRTSTFSSSSNHS